MWIGIGGSLRKTKILLIRIKGKPYYFIAVKIIEWQKGTFNLLLEYLYFILNE